MTVNPNEALALPQVSLEQLLAETRQYLAPKDMESIQRAYEMANRAHMGASRRSGEPFIQHPLAVAFLLAGMRIDADGIMAALLHDVVEDTSYTLDDLREQFGTAVANIVDGVTKFNALTGEPLTESSDVSEGTSNGAVLLSHATSTKELMENKRRQGVETVRKMLLAMAEDPRVVVLKLADRLHNMRTLGVMKPVTQQNKARETMDIYAPLARRLGMILVQGELEDLAFSYLEPARYAMLAHEVEEEYRRRQPYVDEVCASLQEEMKRVGIHAEVQMWRKHLASINRKLQQGTGRIDEELSQMHDLVSFRILLDSVHECYVALGHIHALWRPKDGRIKDFIATPKVNGYQSLHTTVFCLDKQLAEVQIRTHDMQRIADYGIASYWYLKERKRAALSYPEMIAWIERLRDWQRDLPQNADEFVEAVKGDIFHEQIFVFTPKGEVKDLPRGSTTLDMAYRIHTDIGEHCAGARIITNMGDSGQLVTRLVPLDYQLKSGEVVNIVTNRMAHPTRDWLAFARTASARDKIRRYLKTHEREITLQLDSYPVMKEVGGGSSRNDAVDEVGLPTIEGAVKLARCCCPLPGDAIVGFLNPSKGIIVHREDCRTLDRSREHVRGRFVEVSWRQIAQQSYLAPVVIIARDRAGLLRDIAAIVADAGVNMTALTTQTNASLRKAVITATLEIEAVDQIEPIFQRLRGVKSVVSVDRDLGHRIS